MRGCLKGPANSKFTEYGKGFVPAVRKALEWATVSEGSSLCLKRSGQRLQPSLTLFSLPFSRAVVNIPDL